MSNNVFDVAIIGAGLSGLSCAQVLAEANRSVRLLDKGRGIGGRLATRRIERDGERALFDHGAQFFTARSPEFQAEIARWSEAGLVREWFHGQSTLLEDNSVEAQRDGHPRFCCPRGMSAIAKHLGQNLDIQTDARIVRLEHDGDIWTLHSQDGQPTRCKYLVLTPPVPQSLDLLDASQIMLPKEARQSLEGMRYERCIAVMLWLSEPLRLPGEGALYARTPLLSWLGDNASKGFSEVPALTLHGAPGWSEAHWEAGDAEVTEALSQAARQFWSGDIVASSVARWKFSKPIEPRQDGCQPWREKRLVFAGDAFGGAKVEGAWASGRIAAKEALSALDVR